MYKLEVKLKQHTPLIHFQHDQEGATLRASEVKPKLDRFILTRLGGGEVNFGHKDDSEDKKNENKEKTEKYKQQIQEIKQQNPAKKDYEIGILYAKGQGWLVGKGDKPALDYKMRSCGKGKKDRVILSIYTKIKIVNRIKKNFYFTTYNNRKEEFPFILANMGGKEKSE